MKMIHELIIYTLVFMAGMALGLLFFGGLWLTVRRAMKSTIPSLWFLGSLLLRLSLTIGGFYYLSRFQWQGLLISLLGFVVARVIVFYVSKAYEAKQIEKEVPLET